MELSQHPPAALPPPPHTPLALPTQSQGVWEPGHRGPLQRCEGRWGVGHGCWGGKPGHLGSPRLQEGNAAWGWCSSHKAKWTQGPRGRGRDPPKRGSRLHLPFLAPATRWQRHLAHPSRGGAGVRVPRAGVTGAQCPLGQLDAGSPLGHAQERGPALRGPQRGSRRVPSVCQACGSRVGGVRSPPQRWQRAVLGACGRKRQRRLPQTSAVAAGARRRAGGRRASGHASSRHQGLVPGATRSPQAGPIPPGAGSSVGEWGECRTRPSSYPPRAGETLRAQAAAGCPPPRRCPPGKAPSQPALAARADPSRHPWAAPLQRPAPRATVRRGAAAGREGLSSGPRQAARSASSWL